MTARRIVIFVLVLCGIGFLLGYTIENYMFARAHAAQELYTKKRDQVLTNLRPAISDLRDVTSIKGLQTPKIKGDIAAIKNMQADVATWDSPPAGIENNYKELKRVLAGYVKTIDDFSKDGDREKYFDSIASWDYELRHINDYH